MRPSGHERKLRDLVAVQVRSGDLLRRAALRAHEDGMTWARIAEIIGLQSPTLWRQCKAGSPVVVIRPFHSKEEE